MGTVFILEEHLQHIHRLYIKYLTDTSVLDVLLKVLVVIRCD